MLGFLNTVRTEHFDQVLALRSILASISSLNLNYPRSRLKAKAAMGEAAKDVQLLTTNLDITLQKLLLANNTVTSTLTFPGMGYFDKPKPK
jgi:hypothetical protein